MSINLSMPPSMDCLGVKKWTSHLGDTIDLIIFERPKGFYEDGRRFLLHLFNGAKLVGVSYARNKVHAARLARHIHRDVDFIKDDEAFCVIQRSVNERGIRQKLALLELERRGLWLTREQKHKAGLER